MKKCFPHNIIVIKNNSLNITGFPQIFKTIFHAFSMLNEKTKMPSLIVIFPKFHSWTTQCKKTSAKLSSAARNKISINKWLDSEFPYFFNTFNTAR